MWTTWTQHSRMRCLPSAWKDMSYISMSWINKQDQKNLRLLGSPKPNTGLEWACRVPVEFLQPSHLFCKIWISPHRPSCSHYLIETTAAVWFHIPYSIFHCRACKYEHQWHGPVVWRFSLLSVERRWWLGNSIKCLSTFDWQYFFASSFFIQKT